MESNYLFSVGTVIKKDWLILNDRIDDKSALVFISEHPYSGYYGTTVPDKKEPQSMFLITEHNYNDDKIIRSVQNVKKHFEHAFDAVPGTISFLNRHLGMIRIRCVSYQHVPGLIKALKNEGIVFMTHRRFPPFEGIIRITKYFKTEQVEEGIYLDLDNPYFAYLHIDKHLRWNTFENVSRDIKNNITDFSFDAALATMYNEQGILDFVRTYDEKKTVEKLRTIYSKLKDRLVRY